LHLVVYHHSSLHTTPVHRFIPYFPWWVFYSFICLSSSFTLFYFHFYWFYFFTPYYERDIATMYILPQHDFISLLCIKIFYVCPILSLSFILIVFSVLFRLAS
jgi:hypothetical protein